MLLGGEVCDEVVGNGDLVAVDKSSVESQGGAVGWNGPCWLVVVVGVDDEAS